VVSHINTFLSWACGFDWKWFHIFLPYSSEPVVLSRRGVTYLYLSLKNLWVCLKGVSHISTLLWCIFGFARQWFHIFIFSYEWFHIFLPYSGEPPVLSGTGFTYLHLSLMNLWFCLTRVSHICTFPHKNVKCYERDVTYFTPLSDELVGLSKSGFIYSYLSPNNFRFV
jgi:hypothetical protein